MLQKGLLFCMAFPALASLAMARLDAELFLWTFYFLPFFAFVLGGLGWLGTRFSRQERLLLYGFGTVYGILSAVLLLVVLVPEFLEWCPSMVAAFVVPVLGGLWGNLAGICRLQRLRAMKQEEDQVF